MKTKEILENIKQECSVFAKHYDSFCSSKETKISVLIYILSDIALSLRGSKDE